jgi:hypothetical protein
MNRRIGYPNARSVAYAVKRELENRGWHKITARPWNMYDPDHTFWWLVPGTEWPAYQHGKLFFSPDHAPDGFLFCGLHMEKGLDLSVASAYESRAGKRLIMDEDWAWHGFFKDLGTEKLSHALEHASREIAAPVLIRLDAGIVQDPGSFDPLAPRPKWDNVIFETSGDFLKIESKETPSNILDDIARSKDMSRLNKAISEIKTSGWIWLDFFIGSLFEKTSASSDPDSWNAKLLWNKGLSWLGPWFN